MSGAINTDHLVDNSVTSIKIDDGTIEMVDIAPGVIKWYDNGADIYYTGANVAIGNTTPDTRFSIYGGANINALNTA